MYTYRCNFLQVSLDIGRLVTGSVRPASSQLNSDVKVVFRDRPDEENARGLSPVVISDLGQGQQALL